MYEPVVIDRSSSWYFKTLETMSSKQRNSGIVQPAERDLAELNKRDRVRTRTERACPS